LNKLANGEFNQQQASAQKDHARVADSIYNDNAGLSAITLP